MGAVHATGDQVITVYDDADNVIWAYNLLALLEPPAQVLSQDNPIEGPMGRSLFVEVTGSGGYTAGPLTVSGRIRVA